MPEYKVEFCGADGKEQYRIYDATGNAICYAQNEKQAEAVCNKLNALSRVQLMLRVGMPEYDATDMLEIVDEALKNATGK